MEIIGISRVQHAGIVIRGLAGAQLRARPRKCLDNLSINTPFLSLTVTRAVQDDRLFVSHALTCNPVSVGNELCQMFSQSSHVSSVVQALRAYMYIA